VLRREDDRGGVPIVGEVLNGDRLYWESMSCCDNIVVAREWHVNASTN
jgi:hypothetical protein